MIKRHIPYLLLSLLVALLLACGEGSESTGAAEGDTKASTAESGSDNAKSTESGDKTTAPNNENITLTALEGSPEFKGASLSHKGKPTQGDDGSYTFNFEVDGYELGAQTDKPAPLANSGKGQHIHFIVDNGPYSAHYDPTVQTDKLKEAGNHVVLAFLSRSYHESVKNMGRKKSYYITQVQSGDGDAAEADLTQPHMFYSRPKGTYKGEDTKKLLLDFFLLNIDELSTEGYKVHAHINGKEFVLTEWKPYVIEGLPMGEVTIKLELIDAGGNVVPGPFNSVTRTVTLAPAEGA